MNRAEWTASVAELVGLSHEAADRRSRKTGSAGSQTYEHEGAIVFRCVRVCVTICLQILGEG